MTDIDVETRTSNKSIQVQVIMKPQAQAYPPQQPPPQGQYSAYSQASTQQFGEPASCSRSSQVDYRWETAHGTPGLSILGRQWEERTNRSMSHWKRGKRAELLLHDFILDIDDYYELPWSDQELLKRRFGKILWGRDNCEYEIAKDRMTDRLERYDIGSSF